MKKQIVVASYKTNLSFLKNKWCKDIPHVIYEKEDKDNFKDLILNKNKRINDLVYTNPVKKTVYLPNVGLVSHVILFHIIRNYEKLADYTIFIAGDCLIEFGPNVKAFEKIQNINHESPDFINVCGERGKFPSKWPNVKKNSMEWNKRFRTYYKSIFKEECPEVFYPAIDATFAVSKKSILRRPKSFYENIIKYVDERCYTEDYWKNDKGESILLGNVKKYPHKGPKNLDFPGCAMLEHMFQKIFDPNFK